MNTILFANRLHLENYVYLRRKLEDARFFLRSLRKEKQLPTLIYTRQYKGKWRE